MTSTDKTAAVLTIHEASDMTQEGKRDIAKWLRRQARMLEKDGGDYAFRFTARYLYREDEAA